MKDYRLYCAGCVLINQYPNDCGECPHLVGDYNKYTSLMKNYSLLTSLYTMEGINKSVLNRIYRKAINKLGNING